MQVTQLFAPYLQHFVMTIGWQNEQVSHCAAGQMVMQTGFNLWLSSLFLTRGEYFKALKSLGALGLLFALN